MPNVRHGEIWLAEAGNKVRPVVILTRNSAPMGMNNIIVAPITSTIRGISTEVRVGEAEGLHHESVISCDNISTIDKRNLHTYVGVLDPNKLLVLHETVIFALDLR